MPEMNEKNKTASETGSPVSRSRYNNPAMQSLAAQVTKYGPADVRQQQIERAERFLTEVDPDGEYHYQEVCKRVTDYRPDSYPDLVMDGRDVQHDVRCLIEDLSDSMPLDVGDVDEEVLTVDEVSKRYNVSTKTVDRWRDRGLASRRFLFGKRKRIGFLESTVERFVSQHEDEVTRGSNFTQLSEREKEEIIRRARRLAREGSCASDVTRTLATSLDRSQETIRYTLKNHDAEHPEAAVFPDASLPLTEDRKKELLRRFNQNVPVPQLAKEFCRSRNSIYRIIMELRAAAFADDPMEFMDSEEFQAEDADTLILSEPPEGNTDNKKVRIPPGLPPYLATLYTIPLLNKAEEQYYFRKMNYLRFKAHSIREEMDLKRPKAKQIDEIEKNLDEANEIKNFLIRSNLRLVVSIAKKHISPSTNFFEMVSDGNMSLIRAIEKFDYTRGFKFSTYASWAIMKNFARSIPAAYKQQDRYRTGHDEMFGSQEDENANVFQQELNNRQQRVAIMGILDELDDRERQIIINRYGLGEDVEPLTLEQVGQQLGVTKERIRQLEKRAIGKLRKVADEQKLDVPGI